MSAASARRPCIACSRSPPRVVGMAITPFMLTVSFSPLGSLSTSTGAPPLRQRSSCSDTRICRKTGPTTLGRTRISSESPLRRRPHTCRARGIAGAAPRARGAVRPSSRSTWRPRGGRCRAPRCRSRPLRSRRRRPRRRGGSRAEQQQQTAAAGRRDLILALVPPSPLIGPSSSSIHLHQSRLKYYNPRSPQAPARAH